MEARKDISPKHQKGLPMQMLPDQIFRSTAEWNTFPLHDSLVAQDRAKWGGGHCQVQAGPSTLPVPSPPLPSAPSVFQGESFPTIPPSLCPCCLPVTLTCRPPFTNLQPSPTLQPFSPPNSPKRVRFLAISDSTLGIPSAPTSFYPSLPQLL